MIKICLDLPAAVKRTGSAQQGRGHGPEEIRLRAVLVEWWPMAAHLLLGTEPVDVMLAGGGHGVVQPVILLHAACPVLHLRSAVRPKGRLGNVLLQALKHLALACITNRISCYMPLHASIQSSPSCRIHAIYYELQSQARVLNVSE